MSTPGFRPFRSQPEDNTEQGSSSPHPEQPLRYTIEDDLSSLFPKGNLLSDFVTEDEEDDQEDGGIIHYPFYPFMAGYIEKTFQDVEPFREAVTQFGGIREIPDRESLWVLLGQHYSLYDLKVFLTVRCGIQEHRYLSWSMINKFIREYENKMAVEIRSRKPLTKLVELAVRMDALRNVPGFTEYAKAHTARFRSLKILSITEGRELYELEKKEPGHHYIRSVFDPYRWYEPQERPKTREDLEACKVATLVILHDQQLAPKIFEQEECGSGKDPMAADIFNMTAL